MKKIALLLAVVVLLTGCGTPLNAGGKTYPTYGFFNADSSKSDKMCYEVSIGNVVWSAILIETVVVPIYFVGFSLFNPTHLKVNGSCGIDG